MFGVHCRVFGDTREDPGGHLVLRDVRVVPVFLGRLERIPLATLGYSGNTARAVHRRVLSIHV